MKIIHLVLFALPVWATAPTADFGAERTVRAAHSFTLDGSTSTGTAPLSYFWQQLAGPVTCTFSSYTSVSTTVSGCNQFGQYTFQLTVTNADGVSTTSVNIGAVSTDSNDVIIFPTVASGTGDLSTIMGQITRWGSSPWTEFAVKEGDYADAFGTGMPSTYPGSTPEAGTITVTNSSTSVTGSGTSFTSVFACNGTDWIMIYYPLSAGGTGRREYIVSSCADNTHLTLSTNFVQDPGATNPASSVQFAYMSNTDYGAWRNGSNNWNYYDCVLGMYVHYYRTGLTRFRDYARTLAANYWIWPLDEGRAWNNGTWTPAPRLAGLQGIMLYAIEDSQSSIWASLATALSQQHGAWYTNLLNPAYPTNMVADEREVGYAFLFAGEAAILDPDSTRRTTYAGYGADYYTYLSTRQQGDGSFLEIPGGSDGVTGNGLSPWRGSFLAKALRTYYVVSGSSTVLTMAKDFAAWILSDGYANTGTCRGVWYSVGYSSCNSNAAHGDLTPTLTGTVDATNGATAIVGTGTNFTTSLLGSGATYLIVAPSTANIGDDYIGIPVSSITDDTHLTLSSGYSGSTESTRPAYKGLKCDVFGSLNVQHVDTDCPATPTRGMTLRTIAGPVHELAGWMYAQTGTASYLTIGDDLFSANLAYGVGPGEDGGSGNFNDYEVYGIATAKGKYFGETLGAGGATQYLAARVGGLAPEDSVNVSLNTKIDSVTNATKVKYTITSPSGTTSTTTCTSSPCTVTADARQSGVALVTIEYLDNSNNVLAIGLPQEITIQ